MKRPLAALLAVLLLALAGCGGDSADGTPSPDLPNADNSAAPTDGPTDGPTEDPTEEPASGHVADYRLDLPDGFEPTEMEGVDAFWFRADGSNVNLVIVEKDESTDGEFQAADAAFMHAVMAVQLDLLELGVEITDRYFNRTELCGLPAYRYCYDLRLEDGTAMTQLYVCVNADKLYAFTFTAMEGDLLPVFEACAENIQFTFE